MKRLNLIGLVMLAGLISAPAWASSPRTYVSVKGADSSGCQVAYPCLTINFALTKTSAGGEVIVLDSANFAPLTITQSVTIETAPGVYAGITPVGAGAGVTVNGITGSSVVLRGLTIYGGGGGDGIDFNSGAALSVENCVINGLENIGIYQTSSGNLFVKDTVIRNCSDDGIRISGSGAVASLDHIRLEGNLGGLVVNRGKASIANSVASGNSMGIYGNADQSASFTVEINVESCLVANNNIKGIESFGGVGSATVRVSNSTVTDNTSYGLFAASGTTLLLSRLNNTVEGNGVNTSGTIGTYAAQ